jgi:aspartate racemase
MEQHFYQGRFIDAHGFDVLIPDSAERDVIHRVIYDELTRGVIQPQSRTAYVEIIERMAKEGAEGAILGCTEIGLLIKQSDSPIPVFDTTYLHAIAAVDFALS